MNPNQVPGFLFRHFQVVLHVGVSSWGFLSPFCFSTGVVGASDLGA
jgi:hypothetical protein